MPLVWERLLGKLSLGAWLALSQCCRATRNLSQGPSAEAVLRELAQVCCCGVSGQNC